MTHADANGARETDGRTDEAGGAASSPPLWRLRLSSDVIACPTKDFPEVACALPPVRLSLRMLACCSPVPQLTQT